MQSRALAQEDSGAERRNQSLISHSVAPLRNERAGIRKTVGRGPSASASLHTCVRRSAADAIHSGAERRDEIGDSGAEHRNQGVDRDDARAGRWHQEDYGAEHRNQRYYLLLISYSAALSHSAASLPPHSAVLLRNEKTVISQEIPPILPLFPGPALDLRVSLAKFLAVPAALLRKQEHLR